MKWSQFFIPTLKEVPMGTEAVSHQLLLRSGLVHMLTSGVYSYLPLGLRVLKKIENIIREEMNAVGAIELFLPCLHPLEVWKQTGRDEVLDEVMIKFKDNRGREMCLGPTHEEIITDLVKSYIQSYKQLPMTLYQIQTKFRDELRTRFGIVRACEFIMKDAYSFDRNEEGLKVNYDKMYEAYQRIFKRLDLDIVILSADSGAMGGKVSHEFMLPAAIGEDSVLGCDGCDFKCGEEADLKEGGSCPQCKGGTLSKLPAIELGHIFQLGTKYSQAQGALFLDENGRQQPIIMGCYGIGVSRVIAAIIESYNDEDGIKWPKNIAPFDVEILPIPKGAEEEVEGLTQQYYDELINGGLDVLIDDRNESPGRKFKDADLIGLPICIIIGKRNLADGKVEIKVRETGEKILVDKVDVVSNIQELRK